MAFKKRSAARINWLHPKCKVFGCCERAKNISSAVRSFFIDDEVCLLYADKFVMGKTYISSKSICCQVLYKDHLSLVLAVPYVEGN